MAKNNVQQIIAYYEHCESNYRDVWDLDQSLAMHFGFWDQTTATLPDALRRENEIVADLAQVRSKDRVLDAGCGVGGTSIFLAEKYGCRSVGINVCEKHVAQAIQHARQRKTTPLPKFETCDFTKTSFSNESFDVILAIESVCHTPKKADFITEAFRLLKKGGRVVIADGFRTQKKVGLEEKKLLQAYGEGWAECTWEIRDEFEKLLLKQGFLDITYRNVTEQVFPSLQFLYEGYLSTNLHLRSQHPKPSEALALSERLKIKNGLSSTLFQYQCYKKKLLEFGLFFARKN